MEEEIKKEIEFFCQNLPDMIVKVDPRFRLPEEAPEVWSRFQEIIQKEKKFIYDVCIQLIENEDKKVSLGVIRLLRYSCLRDDYLSILLINVALKEKDEEIVNDVLLSLKLIATRIILESIFSFAEQGYADALYALQRLIREPDEIKRGIDLARKYITAEEYFLREAALFLLQKYASIEEEAERILEAVKLYKDELFIDALLEAPPEKVLEPLKKLRESVREKSWPWYDLSRVIGTFEHDDHYPRPTFETWEVSNEEDKE